MATKKKSVKRVTKSKAKKDSKIDPSTLDLSPAATARVYKQLTDNLRTNTYIVELLILMLIACIAIILYLLWGNTTL